MSQAFQLSPELARGLLEPERALLAGARNWIRHPSEHRVATSVARLEHAIHHSLRGAMLATAATGETVTIGATMDDQALCGAADAAALRHDRDVFTIERAVRDSRGAPRGAEVEALDGENHPDIARLRFIDVAKAS